MDFGSEFETDLDVLAFDKDFDWEFQPDLVNPPSQERPQQLDFEDESGSGGFVPLPVIVETPVDFVEPQPAAVILPQKMEPPKPKFQVKVRLIKPSSGRERLAVLGAAARDNGKFLQSVPPSSAPFSSSVVGDVGTQELDPKTSTKKSFSTEKFSFNEILMLVFNVNANSVVKKHQGSALLALKMAMMTKTERRRKFAEALRAFDNRFMRCLVSRWAEEDEKHAQDLDNLILQQNIPVASPGQEDTSVTVDGEFSVEDFMDFAEDDKFISDSDSPDTGIPPRCTVWKSVLQDFKPDAVDSSSLNTDWTDLTMASTLDFAMPPKLKLGLTKFTESDEIDLTSSSPYDPMESTTDDDSSDESDCDDAMNVCTAAVTVGPKKRLPSMVTPAKQMLSVVRLNASCVSSAPSTSTNVTLKKTFQPKSLVQKRSAKSGRSDINIKRQKRSSSAEKSNFTKSVAKEKPKTQYSARSSKYFPNVVTNLDSEVEASLASLRSLLCFGRTSRSSQRASDLSKIIVKNEPDQESSAFTVIPDFKTPVKIESKLQPKRVSSLAESPQTPISVAVSADCPTSVITPRTLPRLAAARSKGKKYQNHDEKQKAALWAQLRAKCEK